MDERAAHAPDPSDGSGRGIGTDQWVEQSAQRTARAGALDGPRRRLAAVPVPLRIIAGMALAASFALVSPSDYATRLAFLVALYTLLTSGLNVVAGWAGVLDLSFVAFFGFGAYCYGLLSSPKFGHHWPTWVAVPVVVAGTFLVGLLLALPSRRLSGDYLAIVTLFISQIFVSLANNGDRFQLKLGSTPVPRKPFDLTGGPNGVREIDRWSLGFELRTITHYFLATVVVAGVVMLLLYRLRGSRPGLAIRAMREDDLAANVLSVPVRRLRLHAYALGAAIAGLGGTLFAAVQRSVFGSNFDTLTLVILYAAVIIGGLGSLGGGAVGAAIVILVPELLRDATIGRLLIYGALLAFVAWRLRGARLAQFLAAFAATAVAVRAGLAVAGADLVPRAGGVRGVLDLAVPRLADAVTFGNVVFVATVAGGLFLTIAPPRLRPPLAGAVAYAGMLTWENRLAEQPSIARQLLVGAVLVGVIAARPHGFFGAKRVEVL